VGEEEANNLSTKAAHAKLGMSIGGCSETLSHPMKSMAVRTFNIHSSQSMNRPIRTKRLACRREQYQQEQQEEDWEKPKPSSKGQQHQEQ
jgi:hypothetical protein